jgi:hypothetical protein
MAVPGGLGREHSCWAGKGTNEPQKAAQSCNVTYRYNTSPGDQVGREICKLLLEPQCH